MRKVWLGVAFIIVFFFILIGTLSHYGINEDSPVHFLRGQAYLHLLTTGQHTFDQPRLTSPVLYIPDQRISTYKYNSAELNVAPQRPIVNFDGSMTIQERFKAYEAKYGRHSFYESNAWGADTYKTAGHPPVSDELEAVFNRIFYQKLGVVGDIEGYYLYVVVTAVIAVLTTYLFAAHVFGPLTAFFAGVTLALYPLFFAESHFNIKDIPELCFFTLSLIASYYWITTRKIDWFITLCITFLLGVGTKLNIVFLPVILLPWLISIRNTEVFKKWFTKKLFIYGSIFCLGIGVLFVYLWPFLWEAPFSQFLSVLGAYSAESTFDVRIQQLQPFMLPGGFDTDPLVLFFTQTPPIMLLLWVVGMITIVRVRRMGGRLPNNVHILLVSWMAVPLLRVLRPNADTFQTIRSYMEFLPAFAIICGIGGNYLTKYLQKFFRRRTMIFVFAVSLYVLSLSWVLIRFHPNENVYYNFFIGGLPGAERTGAYNWRSAYSNPYRQAMNWLNAHAEPHARLAYLDGTMQGIPSIWLRPDIPLGSYFSGFERKGEYIVTMVYPKPPLVFPYLYLEQFLTPLFEVKQDGVALARVYQNDLAHTKPDRRDIVNVPKPFHIEHLSHVKLGAYWQVDLGDALKITSLTLELPQAGCTRQDGLFKLGTYIVPERVDTGQSTITFYFPGAATNTIQFYGLYPTSCLEQGSVSAIEAVKE